MFADIPSPSLLKHLLKAEGDDDAAGDDDADGDDDVEEGDDDGDGDGDAAANQSLTRLCC